MWDLFREKGNSLGPQKRAPGSTDRRAHKGKIGELGFSGVGETESIS